MYEYWHFSGVFRVELTEKKMLDSACLRASMAPRRRIGQGVRKTRGGDNTRAHGQTQAHI